MKFIDYTKNIIIQTVLNKQHNLKTFYNAYSRALIIQIQSGKIFRINNKYYFFNFMVEKSIICIILVIVVFYF